MSDIEQPGEPGSGEMTPPKPGKTGTEPRGEAWERTTLERLATSWLGEQRTARRWRIFSRPKLLTWRVVFRHFAIRD